MTLPQSGCSIAFRCRQEIHEVAGCFPIFLVLKRYIEIGGGPEHVQERPQCKALAVVLLRAASTFHVPQIRSETSKIADNYLSILAGDIASPTSLGLMSRHECC